MQGKYADAYLASRDFPDIRFRMNNLSKNIIYLRKRCGGTQANYAKRVGLTQPTISRIISNGRAEPDTLSRIAIIEEVTIDQLMNGELWPPGFNFAAPSKKPSPAHRTEPPSLQAALAEIAEVLRRHWPADPPINDPPAQAVDVFDPTLPDDSRLFPVPPKDAGRRRSRDQPVPRVLAPQKAPRAGQTKSK